MTAAAAALQPASPPELSLAEGTRWCEAVERRSGLWFPESQRHYLRRALWERMQRAGVDSYAAYYRRLETGPVDSEEWRGLLGALLNPETQFFRHQPSFAALEKLLRGSGAARRLWSAGCSTGEEAYSLAMAADAVDVNALVVGSDWQPESIERARAAEYAARQLAHVPAGARLRYFREARQPGEWRVVESIRRRVRFEVFHLLEPATYPAMEFDAIFCFNVLVYFRPETRQTAARALLTRLKPGGWLFLAPGETAGLHVPGAERKRLEGTQVWQRLPH